MKKMSENKTWKNTSCSNHSLTDILESDPFSKDDKFVRVYKEKEMVSKGSFEAK